ncbi:CubicO group peptidase (beta-lactamase class C family) [Microbacteriaceae bacterium SG_E_30_P1]|uniref:CubicO group peptidase (Beta-lactamase class C family) n=1 Tax=Antiquaquibacter oligotrophicus TaxID=2880260 RepID=A0ABT6KR98_9MICO|nr:serine hydrolase domain-containing protein [Antiquaquibacter oligotrophicus]MDH6182512.1 CubicO group peptidase (beta-lactamase class C family) [Antiquaquibacter oligotrophicus]UDF14518.1 beta-lactamase family protein [Antiquaquibacter oligotrophicus]
MDTTGLDDVLAENEFSGVVVIRRDSGTLYEAAAGLATRRWDVPNTLDTRFDCAGITKLFTSVAVLQQVAKGNLDLETSIHYYVDLEGSAIDPEVTLLHLLTHTSGIADDVDEEAGESYTALYASTPSYTLIETIDLLPIFADKPALAPAGVEAAYSNAGYVLAGLAVERVTGVPYRQYVFDEVLTRAAMRDSGFYDRREAAPRIAEGWELVEGVWRSTLFDAPPIGSPDTGAQVTASDLVLFLEAVRDGSLLDKEFTDEFLTPQVEVGPGVAYGFGLEFDLNDDGSIRSYFQDGIGAGASGIVRHYVEERLDVAVLSNSEDVAWPIIREIDERLGG